MKKEKYEEITEENARLFRQYMADLHDTIEFIEKIKEPTRRLVRAFVEFFNWMKNNMSLLRKIILTAPDKKKVYRKFVESLQKKRHDKHTFSKRRMNHVRQNVFLVQRRKTIPKQ